MVRLASGPQTGPDPASITGGVTSGPASTTGGGDTSSLASTGSAVHVSAPVSAGFVPSSGWLRGASPMGSVGCSVIVVASSVCGGGDESYVVTGGLFEPSSPVLYPEIPLMSAHEALIKIRRANPAARTDRTPSLVRCEEFPRNAFSYPGRTNPLSQQPHCCVRHRTE